jgi:SOS-response transcriptional repressor LexA
MTERSTKRQRELLLWVDAFIKEHGYGPSYREVMNGLGYKSVSTVAVHINGLIERGYLQKRDNSARSLEVISATYGNGAGPAGAGGGALSGGTGAARTAREKWLVEAVNARFALYDQKKDQMTLDELYVLIGALKVLGFDGAYEAMRSKLSDIVRR